MPEYGYQHRKVKAAMQREIDAGRGWCVEVVCLMATREIPPHTPGRDWHVCHDTTGQVIIGPGHARCNTSEGAVRGNRMRGETQLEW